MASKTDEDERPHMEPTAWTGVTQATRGVYYALADTLVRLAAGEMSGSAKAAMVTMVCGAVWCARHVGLPISALVEFVQLVDTQMEKDEKAVGVSATAPGKVH